MFPNTASYFSHVTKKSRAQISAHSKLWAVMAEEYRQRLDNNVEKLVENFKGLVKTAKIKDSANTTRESFQSSIYATTLVQASESLLKLVSEMKLSLALGDFEGMSQNVDTTSTELLKR